MSNTTISRLSGLALMMAFLFSLTGGLLHPVIEHQSHSVASASRPEFPVAHLLIFLGGAFLLVGLPGLYTRMAPKAGLLGLTGFVLYFLTNATVVQGSAAHEPFVSPVVASNPATSGLIAPNGALSTSVPFALMQGIGGIAFMLGMLTLGIAVVRSHVFPGWTGVLLAVAPLLLLLPIPETPVLTGLLIELPRGMAVAAIGYMLVTHHKSEDASDALPLGRPVVGTISSKA